jgi:hypothetical protein
LPKYWRKIFESIVNLSIAGDASLSSGGRFLARAFMINACKQKHFIREDERF